jgi:arginine decarboxylase
MQIRVVTGTGAGRTALSAYDAALAAANVHDYNLVSVSSVVPQAAEIDLVEEAPDLGPVGSQLTVVQSRSVTGPETEVSPCAALGWVRAADGRGVFYEAAGTDLDGVRREVETGLADGASLREWSPGTPTVETVVADPNDPAVVAGPRRTRVETDGHGRRSASDPSPELAGGHHTAAIALAIYGSADPIAE